jgi:hypothetical protein
VVPQHLIHHLLGLIEMTAPRSVVDLLHGRVGVRRQSRHAGHAQGQDGSDKCSSNQISHMQPQNGRSGR